MAKLLKKNTKSHEIVSAHIFLKKIKKTDVVFVSNIKLKWTSIVKECKKLAKKFPKYEEHANKKNIKEWEHAIGYNKHNTKIWKTSTNVPELEVKWKNKITASLPIADSVVTPTLQKPGNILPWHKDRFFYIRKKYQIDRSKIVVRFLLFLENWKIGHFIQVKNTVITKWQAGDLILWHPDAFHLSANVGLEDKWTCNITAVLDRKISGKLLHFVDMTN